MGTRWTGWALTGVVLLAVGALLGSLGAGEPRLDVLLVVLARVVQVTGTFILAVSVVLLALEVAGLYDPRPQRVRRPRRQPDHAAPDDAPIHAAILDALQQGPATVDGICDRTGLYQVVVRRSLPALVASGLERQAGDRYVLVDREVPAGG